MQQNTTDDELKQRTTDFMHALAASEVDAANISADRTGAGMMVHAYIPADEVDDAEAIAEDHDFDLYGHVGGIREGDEAAAEGRVRYRFETEADR